VDGLLWRGADAKGVPLCCLKSDAKDNLMVEKLLQYTTNI
jgi:hypothetical protein